MNIFKLVGSILVDSDAAEKSISKTGKEAEGLGTKLGKGIKTAAKFGAALGAGALVAGGAMFGLGVKLGNTADRLLDLNSITGMSTDEIQRWEKVTKVAGVSSDAMTNASQKLTKSLDTMVNSGGKGAESLEALGLSVEEVANMNADERMNAITEALAGVEDKTERAKIGTDLLGGSWKDIAPIVDMGADAMNKAKDSANIISEEDLNKANEFRIKVEEMKDQLGFFATKIAIAVMPTLHKVMDWAQDKLPLVQSFFESAFDVAGEAIGKVSDFISAEVMPRLSELWDWLSPKLPEIKQLFTDSFGVAKDVLMDVVEAIKDTTKWIEDHWNIVEPILIGIATGITTFYLITGAIAAYGAITKAITAIQLAFNTALALNSIGLVVIAIGLLVAAGVMLWKNWDVVKAKVKELWSALTSRFTEIKSNVTSKVNELKTNISNKFSEIKSSAVTRFNEVKDAILNPIHTARDKVKTAVDKIKGFFTGMKLELPKIKVPSFSLKNWSRNPIDWLDKMPSIGINWNAHGGLFTKPTVLNTPYGLQGFGESGTPEAALPLSASVLGMIGQKISDTMSKPVSEHVQNVYITVEGNIDKDFYHDLMTRQKRETDTKLMMRGVREN
ncbi:hypothetical protein [Halalkalibacter flavus]|uniref:hypothetical protein n=1 Tax=Halalkalibacter flavus TaxID=3090668 RepID=UPI002FCA9DCD